MFVPLFYIIKISNYFVGITLLKMKNMHCTALSIILWVHSMAIQLINF